MMSPKKMKNQQLRAQAVMGTAPKFTRKPSTTKLKAVKGVY